jgi:hypothetical protein
MAAASWNCMNLKQLSTSGINLEIGSKFGHCRNLLMISILKSIVNSGTVENYRFYQSGITSKVGHYQRLLVKSLVNSGTVEITIGINLEIVIKFRHYSKLLVVSILRSIVNLGTAKNHKQLRSFFVGILQLWQVFILPRTKTIWTTLGALLTFFSSV